jgi:hypothetical protein
MAKRTSGNVTVRLTFDGTRDAYVCSVAVEGEKAKRVIVGYPAVCKGAVDSAESYDSAARAAIAFADATGGADYETVPLGPHGSPVADRIHVRRVR